MANERVYTLVNKGTEEKPVWEIWFAITVADAVKMTDDPEDPTTIVDYVNNRLQELIGGAPETYDTLKELADYIASHQEVADALNAAIGQKADKAVATASTDGLMSRADKAKLDGMAEGANKYVHPSNAGYKHIPAGGSAGQVLKWQSDGTAGWAADTDTKYSDMRGASADAAGAHGLVPAPAAGAQGRYLRGDGTWTSPPNTTYKPATSTTDGLMSKTDKTKLDNQPGIQIGSEYPASMPANSIFLLIRG